MIHVNEAKLKELCGGFAERGLPMDSLRLAYSYWHELTKSEKEYIIGTKLPTTINKDFMKKQASIIEELAFTIEKKIRI